MMPLQQLVQHNAIEKHAATNAQHKQRVFGRLMRKRFSRFRHNDFSCRKVNGKTAKAAPERGREARCRTQIEYSIVTFCVASRAVASAPLR